MTASRNTVDLRKRDPGALPRAASPLRFPDKKARTPLRVRRRRTRALLALAVVILLALCAWGVSYISYLPRFNVSSVSIVGATTVPPDVVQTYVQTQLHDGSHPYLSPDNIFIYNPSRLAREIVGYFPRIKSARVSRASTFAIAITVSITERQHFALWCGDMNDCYQMDDDGFVFAESGATSSAQQYVFAGGIATSSDSTGSPQAHPIGQSFVPAHLPGILVLLESLAQAGFPAQGAIVENDTDFSVPLAAQNPFTIKASFGEDAGLLVNNLKLILSSDALKDKQDQIEYVDLRFGDRVYYRLKGASETKVPQ